MSTYLKKESYEAPVVDVFRFQTSGSILTASNEGYTVSPFDPEFITPASEESLFF